MTKQHNTQPASASSFQQTEQYTKRWIKVLTGTLGTIVLLSSGVLSSVHSSPKMIPMQSNEHVALDRYLGVWYEIARKPNLKQNACRYDVTATYTLNENGHIHVVNRCYNQQGQKQEVVGEAFVVNTLSNNQLKVSFLPEIVRWIPVARGDYWILKIDDDYQTVLIGDPNRRTLSLLSRQPQVTPDVLKPYLDYAKTQGYDVSDLIYTIHSQAKITKDHFSVRK